jgi:hypothetical protein
MFFVDLAVPFVLLAIACLLAAIEALIIAAIHIIKIRERRQSENRAVATAEPR